MPTVLSYQLYHSTLPHWVLFWNKRTQLGTSNSDYHRPFFLLFFSCFKANLLSLATFFFSLGIPQGLYNHYTQKEDPITLLSFTWLYRSSKARAIDLIILQNDLIIFLHYWDFLKFLTDVGKQKEKDNCNENISW